MNKRKHTKTRIEAVETYLKIIFKTKANFIMTDKTKKLLDCKCKNYK